MTDKVDSLPNHAIVVSNILGDMNSFLEILQVTHAVDVEYHDNEKIDKHICIWKARPNTFLILCGNVINDVNITLQDLQLVRCIRSLQEQARKQESHVVWLAGECEQKVLKSKHGVLAHTNNFYSSVKKELLRYFVSAKNEFRFQKWVFTSEKKNIGTEDDFFVVNGTEFFFKNNIDKKYPFPRAPIVTVKSSTFEKKLKHTKPVARLIANKQQKRMCSIVSADVLHYLDDEETNHHQPDVYNDLLDIHRDAIFALRPSFLNIPDMSATILRFQVLVMKKASILPSVW